MGPAAAVRTELLRSFDLKGRTTRAAYLWFLSTSILALAAGIWACHALLPDDQVIRGVCAVIALFYLPVTAAGVRRLHDVGASGLLMLEPLKPGLGLGTALWLLWLLATGTLVGTTSVILATLFFPAVVVALLGIAGLIALIATLIAFSHTMGLLLLPSLPETKS
ncbi:MAG: DUF805 domain-containing protein [Rhodobacteraceae bacterium]|jgi:uncharacterized membrane protein YhaH (DUF805 family)|nr:DUF805 domain-containing protein [Paracoccaceae bacterium]